MDEILLREIPLPHTIGGMTAIDENGDYNIYINSRLSDSKKIEAFNHELSHINSRHFTDNLSVAEKESEIRNGKSEETQIRKLEHPSL